MKKNHEKIWNNCLNTIKENIPSNSFKLWFEPIVPLKFKNNILTVEIASRLFLEFLLERYGNILKKVLIKEIGPDAKLKFVIKTETKKIKPPLGIPVIPRYPRTKKSKLEKDIASAGIFTFIYLPM